MRKSFKQLREAAHEVAETIGMSFDETCTMSSEGYELDKYAFHLNCEGIDFELSVGGKDLDKFFRDMP